MECYALHIKTVLRRPVECGLHAAIGVMNQTAFGVARRVVESLFQRIERLIAAQRLRYALADDAPSERIDNECDVHETAPRRNVHEVRHPQHIGTHDQEVAVHQIGRAWQLLGRRRCLTRIPLRCAYNSIRSIFGAFGNPGAVHHMDYSRMRKRLIAVACSLCEARRPLRQLGRIRRLTGDRPCPALPSRRAITKGTA